MFFLPKIVQTSLLLHCIKNIPLRVHSHTVMKYSKRTSQSASDRGSMTIEAAMLLPILLCAFMGIVMLGKVFFLSRGMDTALLETARQIARKEHLLTMEEKEGTGILLAPAIFSKVKNQGDVGTGLEVSSLNFYGSDYEKDSKEIYLTVQYKVKIPMMLLGTWQISLRNSVRQKVWNGYAPLSWEKKEGIGDYVFVTEDGEAYHIDSQCYHLHISVKAVKNTDEYYDGKTRFRPCEYCVEGQGRKNVLYIPKEGECYHEALDCSGLTRRVSCVAREKIEGRIPCADCCKKK